MRSVRGVLTCGGEPGTVHLRGCGASTADTESESGDDGSPPRVRSVRRPAPLPCARRRFTSAGAERPPLRGSDRACSPVHLRGCGASLTAPATSGPANGSPPRVRSVLGRLDRLPPSGRFTSAGAERPLRVLRVYYQSTISLSSSDCSVTIGWNAVKMRPSKSVGSRRWSPAVWMVNPCSLSSG